MRLSHSTTKKFKCKECMKLENYLKTVGIAT